MGIDYKFTTIENLVEENANLSFDAIVASEVIEHVQNVDVFLSSAVKLLKVRIQRDSPFLIKPNDVITSDAYFVAAKWIFIYYHNQPNNRVLGWRNYNG